jgi:serine/threonine protein kinase
MATANESDPAPPLPNLPDVTGLDEGKIQAGAADPGSRLQLPEVHGLTPPGQPVTGNVEVEFSAPSPDLSAAVTLPTAGPPPAPEPAPQVPPAPPAPAESAPVEPGDRLSAGRMFGGYELVAKIGQGGMGEVYKARQVSLDRVVAIKILAKALYDNEEFIKRFEREAKAIARITHPNIVGVYDFGQIDGLRFMVNEFVDGSSLAKLISDRLILPVPEVIPLMVQCLAGLGHVGSQGIVHRDIKPDNILITKDGVAKIADFGLAKDVSRKDDNTDLTAVGLAMGTPAYMSPEQCMGQKLDVRSDIYAFGITAWFALTGQKPFIGNSSFEVMTKQREYIPPLPHEVVPGIPPGLSAVVMRMLAKKAEDRFPDAESCRLAWVEIGVQQGVFGRGDVETMQRPSQDLPALVPLPPAPQPTSSEPAQVAPVAPVAVVSEPVVPAVSSRLAAPAGKAPGTESVRGSSERHTTEKPSSERAPRKTPDTVSCPRCGHLNLATAAVCGRCGNVLRDSNDAATLLQQEQEAQRLFEVRRFSEAAVIWSRLADREQEKRARSVLRSKEREARKQEHESRLNDLRTRAQAAIGRGDLKGALSTLEQGRDLNRDSAASTTSSSVSDVQLERDIQGLRARLAWRRRAWQIALAVVLVLAAIVALIAIRQGWLGAETLDPAPVQAPATKAVQDPPAAQDQP